MNGRKKEKVMCKREEVWVIEEEVRMELREEEIRTRDGRKYNRLVRGERVDLWKEEDIVE